MILGCQVSVMVDVVGHLGMALVWLAPAWLLFDHRKTAATFVATGFWFGMLPDVDLVLSNYLPGIHHHGVVHTVLAVAVFAVVVGPAYGLVLRRVLADTEWLSERAAARVVSLGAATVFVTGLSHLFADVLSAPDVSTPVEPLWPLVSGRLLSIDVLWYQSFWATWALLLLGVGLNAALWYGQR